MQGGDATKSATKSLDKTRLSLMVTIVALFAVAIALTVAIVINLQSQNTNIVGDDDSNDDTEDEEKVPKYASTEEMIADYQKKIDTATTSEEKVALYNERSDEIILSDDYMEYRPQILEDAISMDKIQQTVSSAAQVCTYAENYGNDAVLKEYQEILKQRQNDTIKKEQGAEE